MTPTRSGLRGLLLNVAPLALVCILCGCNGAKKTASDEGAIRQLDQIPIAQLRVMLKGYPGDWRPDSDRSRQVPEPPKEKAAPPGAKRIPLMAPHDFHVGNMSVREAIAERRSTREFTDAALTLEELSYLLWATQGVTAVQMDDAGKVVQQYRAAPSAGGRFPLETYLAINRVEGIKPGLYRYRPAGHELIMLHEDATFSAQLQTACYGEAFVGKAAVVFIWSAIPYRTEWKYGYISHRMIAIEAGHVCENLYLAAQSSGTAACAVMAYHQPRLDELIGADGTNEFTLYLACVGRPVKPAM